MSKVYGVDNRLGCVELRRRRSTGTVVGVYNGEQAGMDTDNGRYPWSTVCEPHGHIIAHPSLSLAKAHASHPEDWCEVCMGNVK